jgi:hypothetical protein
VLRVTPTKSAVFTEVVTGLRVKCPWNNGQSGLTPAAAHPFRGGVFERDIDHRKIKFQAQSWLAAHSINKNLLQLIRRQPLVRVGLVHDRNASEVSDSSTDERTGTTAPTSKATFAVSPASKFN